MTKITSRFKKMMMVSLGVALLDMIVGILFIAYTSFSMKINLIILGALFLVHGLFYFIRYIYDGFGKNVFVVDLVAGVASIILGVFSIFNTYDASQVIGIVFCIWLVIAGSQKLYFGIKLMKKQDEIYPLTTFIAILLYVMGLLAVFNPFSSFMLITRLVGIFLICAGVFETMSCMLFRKRADSILDMFKV